MGMPATVEVCGTDAAEPFEKVFDYFDSVDRKFSTYKSDSEISCINRKELSQAEYSDDMKEILARAEATKHETEGFFDITTSEGTIDASGIVKGWAINNAAQLLRSFGYENFYVEIGGDIQTSGKNEEGAEWKIGIRNPFDRNQIVKVVYPHGKGVATSGTAARGSHIYNPHTRQAVSTPVASLTVIGPNVYEADRFATAGFAMGERGISFIGSLKGFAGYQIDRKGMATMTEEFKNYL